MGEVVSGRRRLMRDRELRGYIAYTSSVQAHLRELINDVFQERAGVADEVEVVSRHEAQHHLKRMIVRCAYVREAAHVECCVTLSGILTRESNYQIWFSI